MRIFLCGQKQFGLDAFELMQSLGHDVVGVAAPAGDRLYRAAAYRDVPHLIPGGALRAATMPPDVDLILAAHSYDFISAKVLAATRLGGLGYHPSLLPLHRGRDAIRWSIRLGERVTGGTVYWLTQNVDAGPIAAQDYCFIPPGWDARRLWRERLQPLGLRLIAQALADLEQGRLVAIPQEESCATWEPALSQPPIFRPDLPQLGSIPGFEVVASAAQQKRQPPHSETACGAWKRLAGG